MGVKDADPAYWEYRVQPGIIDLDHLELVALKRVSKSLWMPHFRLINPSSLLRSRPPITYFRTLERVNPPQQVQRVSPDIVEGSEAHEQSSVPGQVHPTEDVHTEVHKQDHFSGPAHPAEEAAKVPKPINLTAGNRVSPLKFQGFTLSCL